MAFLRECSPVREREGLWRLLNAWPDVCGLQLLRFPRERRERPHPSAWTLEDAATRGSAPWRSGGG